VGIRLPTCIEGSIRDEVQLSDYKSQTVLLSFIVAHSGGGDNHQGTLSQLTFLKSMRTQYGGNGLRIILIEGSEKAKHEELINFNNDQELSEIPFTKDDRASDVSAMYGVRVLPRLF